MCILDYDDMVCREESDFTDDENAKPESYEVKLVCCEDEHIHRERQTPEQHIASSSLSFYVKGDYSIKHNKKRNLEDLHTAERESLGLLSYNTIAQSPRR